MINDNTYGRAALDKADELEKLIYRKNADEVIPDYSEKTVAETLVSSLADNKIVKKLSWKLYSAAGGQLNVDIKVKQGENVKIYLTHNGKVVFDTQILGGRAIYNLGGHVPVGENLILVELSASAAFTVDFSVTYRGKFRTQTEQDRVFPVGKSDYAFLSDGKFTVYDGSGKTPLFTVYGVICAGAAKLSDGNYCVAAETVFDGAWVKIISSAGNPIKTLVPKGKFTSFAVAASGTSACIYGARQSRLIVLTYNGSTLSEEPTAIRAVEVGYAESSAVKLLRVRNPIGYEYIYKV